ncbi:uncharacterized protein [Linepithema humile]|uniref:uncharacterized protein n=1 Tax=Linepithema humile TaxID=83485 RepID=UPI00351DAD36
MRCRQVKFVSGFKIPFSTLPPSRSYLPEPELSSSDSEEIAKELNHLLRKGAISRAEFSEDQFLSPYFLIDKSSGGKRFILNLKELNKFIDAPHFKIEDLKLACQLLSTGTYLASIDLEDAYFLVLIEESSRKFLRFSFHETIFEFTALSFGLNLAPFVFTKIMKPVASFLRKRGYVSIIYLDDFLLIGDSFEDCKSNVDMTLHLLTKLGFLINHKKTVLTPSRQQRFLGFILDIKNMFIYLPEDKRITLAARVLSFLSKSETKIRDFASFIGALIFVCRAVPYGLLYVRDFESLKFQACENSGDNYEAHMTLPSNLVSDFKWWVHTLASPNIGKPLRRQRFQHEIFFNASLSGWGAAMDNQKTHGWWTTEEKEEHINWLELKAAYYAFRCFANEQPAPDVEEHFPGSREIILQAFRRKGIPESALATSLASLSEGTLKQYARPIKLWWLYCKNKSHDWFQPDIGVALEFLAAEMKNISAYGSLNSIRSALSLITNVNLGSDSRVKRFCKDAAVLKPSKPKYALTWDPNPVIAHLRTLTPHSSLDRKTLTHKLATLIALATASRVQNLALIKRANISLTNPVIIKIPDRIKTSGVNRTQPSMVFHKFEECPELCIASLLRMYIEKTNSLLPSDSDALFLTFGKQPKAASTQTISRWIKKTLAEGGIDTSIFTAHSVRHAATSSAARLNVPLDEIYKSAG